MDRRERAGDPVTGLLAMLQAWQGDIWTQLPCVLLSDLDPVERTVSAQPMIQARAQQVDGTYVWVSLPPLLNCPVIFPSGGGVTLTFPLKAGDEVMIFFACRCIDTWWQSGPTDANGNVTPQVQAEYRMHSLSDGFCMAGLNSVPKVIPNISTTSAQFRSDSGNTYVEVDPHDGFINAVTPGNIHAEAGGNITAHAAGNIEATAEGDATINATTINLNGTLIINGEPYNDHEHKFVTTGFDNTGPKT